MSPPSVQEREDDGWTHVSKNKGRAGRPPPPSNIANPPMKGYTLDQLQWSFDRQLKRWRESTCQKQILQILDRQRPEEGWQIKEAVCLASGSLSREYHAGRAQCQLAAFVDIVHHLQQQEEGVIRAYAQEPQYTDLDSALLGSIGVTLLQCEPGSTLSDLGPVLQYLKPTTFIFEPFMDATPAFCRELCTGDPALYIGSSMRRWTVTQSLHAVGFIRGRGNRHFPRFEDDPNVFEGMSLWWKEPREEDDGMG